MSASINTLIKQSPLIRRESEMIIEHVLGISRAAVIAHSGRVLDDSQEQQALQMIARRAGGEPMAYILGSREFYGLDFMVTPDVLIPRPETELLVEQALARLSSLPAPEGARMLDLGTGSGAIAISVARHFPAVNVTATDVSRRALAVAQRNAAAQGVKVNFIDSDWYSALGNKTFDLIVANPPYIAAGDKHLAEGDLRFEPITALTDGVAGGNGLACIRHIVNDAPPHLNNGGWLLFEHGYDQSSVCAGLLDARGFADVCSFNDLAGIPRVAGGRWNDR
ncbi:MAG TPA: peptide chain release factor N(5)-glutamine methyltransferase [Usitatibacteraceae bacterium]